MFVSKAAKSRELEKVSRAYDKLEDTVRTKILQEFTGPDERHGELYDSLYWGLPFQLHQVRDKHHFIFRRYGHLNEVIELVAVRNEMKEIGVLPRKPKTAADKLMSEIVQELTEALERSKERFFDKLKISRFEGMEVTVDSHEVINQFGTQFWRFKYFLNGKVTSLQHIVGIATVLEDERRAKEKANG